MRSKFREKLGDPLRSADWSPSCCPHAPASIGVGNHIRCKKTLQCGEVSFLCCGDERLEKTSFLVRTHTLATSICNMLASPGHQLAGACFFQLQNVRDLSIRIVECFPKNIGGSLRRREFLEQQQDGEFQGLAAFCSQQRVGSRIYWFRKPRPDIRLVACTRGLTDVDR